MNAYEFMVAKLEDASERLDYCRSWDCTVEEEKEIKAEYTQIKELYEEMDRAGVFDPYKPSDLVFKLD